MKKIIFVISFIFLVYFSFVEYNFLTDTKDNKLRKFTTDWCSMFPDWKWRECCVEHDRAYWKGWTSEDRKKVDLELEKCVSWKWYKTIWFLMRLWVRVWWNPYLPTSFRWAYGWEKFKWYDK